MNLSFNLIQTPTSKFCRIDPVSEVLQFADLKLIGGLLWQNGLAQQLRVFKTLSSVVVVFISEIL